jgi:ligand-binding SRPBCC domain-containing protein
MNSGVYTFRQEQWIGRPIGEVFAFFSDAHNLEQLTPAWLGFKILAMNTSSIAAGTEIDYRLRLHGIPVGWRTEILEWDPPHGFIDIQRLGPYKLWRHTHRFEEVGDGTKMIDEVNYALPFGILGRMVHALKVRSDVQRIFDYRRQRIAELFAPSAEVQGFSGARRGT